LHVPGVVQLDAVAALEAKTGDRTIRSVLTYQRPVETRSDRHPATTLATHVLYLEEGALYVIHLDGSGLHRIAMQTSCYFLGGLDPTGQHGLCWNGQGVQAFGLDEAAISLTPRELVPSNYAYGDVLTYPTLAPDGKHFAALERLGTGAPAAIALYAVDPSFTTAERVATITVPGMAARRLSWSPDGRWLAVASSAITGTASADADATYAVPLVSELSLARLPPYAVPPRQPLTVTVDAAQLIRLKNGLDLTDAWEPTGHDAVWTYTAGGTIWQLDLTTGQQTALLTIPEGAICAFAWTADGRQVVFAQCRLGSSEQVPPPDRLYVYTLHT
jgi:hypothetical protein